MVMLPPTFMVTGMVIQSSMLPKLERVSRVKACRFCLHPHTVYGCGSVPLWSHTSTRQTLAMVTTACSHDTTSVSASIASPPPGLSPQGATAPTVTYSEALTFSQAPQTCVRGVSHLPLPLSRISFSGPLPDGPHPQNGGSDQAGAPGNHTKGTRDSLPTTGTSSCPLHPFHWGQERSHPRDDTEKITEVGVPNCHCRP